MVERVKITLTVQRYIDPRMEELLANFQLGVSGPSPILGSSDPEKARLACYKGEHIWRVDFWVPVNFVFVYRWVELSVGASGMDVYEIEVGNFRRVVVGTRHMEVRCRFNVPGGTWREGGDYPRWFHTFSGRRRPGEDPVPKVGFRHRPRLFLPPPAWMTNADSVDEVPGEAELPTQRYGKDEAQTPSADDPHNQSKKSLEKLSSGSILSTQSGEMNSVADNAEKEVEQGSTTISEGLEATGDTLALTRQQMQPHNTKSGYAGAPDEFVYRPVPTAEALHRYKLQIYHDIHLEPGEYQHMAASQQTTSARSHQPTAMPHQPITMPQQAMTVAQQPVAVPRQPLAVPNVSPHMVNHTSNTCLRACDTEHAAAVNRDEMTVLPEQDVAHYLKENQAN